MAEVLVNVLDKTLSQNPEDQKRALEFLNNASAQDFPTFVKELSFILKAPQVNNFIRKAAGLQLKNVLSAKEEETKHLYLQRWLQLPADVRQIIKTNVMETLGTETSRPSTAAQCAAAIACAEIPSNLWPEVITRLMGNVTDAQSSESLKESSLETLGYICQDIEPQVLESQANSILTAIVNGMKKEEPSNHVRLAATTALLNALEFTHSNFQNESERHIIMQVICETTQVEDIQVKVAALQCLVRIMTLYYQLMETYMRALYPITVQAMKSEEDNVALQGIEFWSNVCEEEIALAVEAEEAEENNKAPERVSRHYAKGATPHLCPLLLETLAKQEEGDDDDDWTPCKAAGVCIMLLAQCVGDHILDSVVPFFPNFTNPNWRYKDAAIMAFGSILDGPDSAKLQPLVEQALPLLIDAMNDPTVTVRDSTAWTIGRILDVCPEIASNENLIRALLPVFSSGLGQEPRVAANVCWALVSLVKAVYHCAVNNGTDSTGQPDTYALSFCFQAMVDELIKTTDRPDSNQSNLRLAAFETLMELIKNSPKDCYPAVQNTTIIMLKKLEQLLSMEQAATNISDKSAVVDLQSLLCATLQSVLRKMSSEDATVISDHIMNGLITIMSRANGKSGSVMEEALLAVAALAESLGANFSKYVQALSPFIVQSLGTYEEPQVCIAGAGLVVDVCRALAQNIEAIAPFLDTIMERLVISLTERTFSQDAKVQILGNFGDIALAIGNYFERYIEHVSKLLREAASAMVVDPNDEAQVDYVDSLRDNVVSSYVGILQSMVPDGADKDDQKKEQAQQNVSRYLQDITDLITKICDQKPEPSESLLGTVTGLIGDLISLYGGQILSLLGNEKIAGLLQRTRKCKSSKNRSLANWALRELRKASNQGSN
ncbi:unnamed protein product [Auanema sp. JU1783]|nr:unnamed protein product [Auanema sp. JU1783]